MEKKNMDLFLFIPCDLTNFIETNLEIKQSDDGAYILNQVEKNNKNEFNNEYFKYLKRYEIGEFTFKFLNDEIYETGKLFITEHPKTRLGVITIWISHPQNNPALLLDIFIASRFYINNEKIQDWAKQNEINLLGTSKSLLFSFEEIKEEEIISILACESRIGQIKGKEFLELAKQDIAQYKVADVYCSENVLLELRKENIEIIKDRIEIEAVEIFFMEIILLQNAAISRICDKILKELKQTDSKQLGNVNTDILDALASELSESILFLDFNNFIYPTVRISAEKIAKNFRIDKLIEKYNLYKDLLESLINIRKNKLEDIETNNMNILLLVLTLTQVIPVFVSMFETIRENTLSLGNIISFISSITVCFILLFIFKYVNKRKKRKYKEKLMNLKNL